MFNLQKDDIVPISVITVVFLIILSVFYMAIKDSEKTDRLINDCINDGNKEYYCESIIRSKSSNSTIFIR